MSNDNMIFRKTNSNKGRHISVTPENSPMKELSYGRVILDGTIPIVSFETGEQETGLICLSGACTVTVGDQSVNLGQFDGVYVPRGSSVEISTEDKVDLAEFSAKVEGDYPFQVVRYSDVEQTPSLKFATGGETEQRTVNIIIGKNVNAGRIMAGVTFIKPGNWASWPPHEHGKMLEELYVYFNMPAPAFGIQLVYDDFNNPEMVTMVKDGDAAMAPSGFHPNIACPGYVVNFMWIMGAHREVEDRQFGVVRVQPEFDKGGSGLEASRK